LFDLICGFVTFDMILYVFNYSLVSHMDKVRPSAGLNVSVGVGRIFQALDFIKDYPIKTLADLKNSSETGLYIVSARVKSIVHVDPWWYPICGCNSIVDTYIGSLYCADCGVSSFLVAPKYVLKILF
jgi:hypothetical protein